MKKFISISMIFTVLLSFFMNPVYAEEDLIKKDMTQKTNELLSIVKVLKENPDMERSEMYTLLNDALKDTFAFRRMAGRIMGKYARSSSESERNLFVENFKSQLFDSYIDGLLSSGEFNLSIDKVKILPENKNRGIVEMNIQNSNGENFMVNYSIFKSKNQWMVENVIVEGVNIGLAFRDSFYQSMEKNRNDLSKAIKNWNVELEDEQ